LGQNLPIPLLFHPLEKDKVFFETKKYTVTAFPVKHQGPGNFGFIFQEKSHRPFLVEKAEALGVPNGPLRGQLVAGHSVTLADGRVIQPDEVLDAPQAGIKLVHVGDCGNVSNLYEAAANADCLVMEATYLDEEKEAAREFGHMTAGGSARFAQEVNAKALILNHISRRSREFEVRQEAQSFFPNTFVARDFDHFILQKGKPIIKKVAQAEADESPA
jgi:ribonuclease Z